MKVLVIGGGGREHALAWKLAQSPKLQCVYVAPGNGGTASDARLENVAITDPAALADFAQREKIVLTVVGPEAPLAAGVVDLFRSRGLRIFGPTRAAAQLESSKAFSKAFMQRHGIPTARYQTFDSAAAAHAYVDAQGAPIVVKADGLAAGKGVVVAMSLPQAHVAIDTMLDGSTLGVLHNDGGARVVIEEFLSGEEASFIVMVDGEHVLPLATSQDHKRLRDDDEGPNTGGMGAYSPAPVVTPNLHAKVMNEIIKPTVAGMRRDGIVFTGFLYAGLMVGGNGQVQVVEFNCRLGDPETQPILFRLRTELADICLSCFDGTLGTKAIDWDPRATVGVVMASGGYPDAYDKGKAITGLDNATGSDVKVFHAGTKLEGGRVVTDGGRVLCVVGTGDSVRAACEAAYAGVSKITWDGGFYRTDIGYRAIQREEAS